MEDPAIIRVRRLFKKSGLTLHELGVKMGYENKIARQSAFQFMRAGDPRISMLRRFAIAIGTTIQELVGHAKPNTKKASPK